MAFRGSLLRRPVAAQAVLAVPADACGLRKDAIAEQWERDHRTVLRSEQQQLQVDKEATGKIMGQTVCARLGVCLCSSPAVLLFFRALAWSMKQLFTKTKNVMSEVRALLEGGYVVMSFCPSPGRPEQRRFFHPGYVNYSTWHFAGLVLLFKRACPQKGTLLLMLGEETCDFLHWSDEGRLSEIQTIFEFAKQLDLSTAWAVQYWRIVSDDEVVPLHEMPARFVEVEQFSEETSFLDRLSSTCSAC